MDTHEQPARLLLNVLAEDSMSHSSVSRRLKLPPNPSIHWTLRSEAAQRR